MSKLKLTRAAPAKTAIPRTATFSSKGKKPLGANHTFSKRSKVRK